MIHCLVEDITKMKVDAITSAANGVGIMGKGVAGAIAIAAGPSIQIEAKDACQKNGKPFEEGSCYVTGSGNLKRDGVKNIYHAVTMKYPGGATSIYIVRSAIKNVLEQAMANDVYSIAIPALGTGIGRLSKVSVSDAMVREAMNFKNDIRDIYICDINTTFIAMVKECLEKLRHDNNIK